MLSAAQAEGYGQGDGSGSILEEYLDTLVVMPVEVMRYITLMRELDEKSERDLVRIKEAQNAFLEKASEEVKGAASKKDRQKKLLKLKGNEDYLALEKTRASLQQKIAEKRSISDQLFDMSEQNLKRIKGDFEQLGKLLHTTGDMPDLGFSKNREVAAWIAKDEVWIHAKVYSFNPQKPDTVVVVDADASVDTSERFTLPVTKVVTLPKNENLSAAKARLSQSGLLVHAIYPGTTSFYSGILVGIPYRDGVSTGVGSRGGAGASSTVFAKVQFQDDVDEATGLTPKRPILAKYVFQAPSQK